MKKLEPTIRESNRLNFYTWSIIVLWTIIVGVLLLFDFQNTKKEFSALARLEALASFNKDTICILK